MGHGTSRAQRRDGLEALGKLFTLTIETFEAFGFAEPLARALTQCGYATPTPIQQQALAPQLEGRDIDTLFSAGPTTALIGDVAGLDDFELIAFIVVRQPSA